MNAERVGVGSERVDVDRARGVAQEAAARHVDFRVDLVRVDEQAGPGVHRRVTGKHAVDDRRRLERSEQRQSALVVLKARRAYARRDACRSAWVRRVVLADHRQRRLVQVHQRFYRVLVHLRNTPARRLPVHACQRGSKGKGTYT